MQNYNFASPELKNIEIFFIKSAMNPKHPVNRGVFSGHFIFLLKKQVVEELLGVLVPTDCKNAGVCYIICYGKATLETTFGCGV